MSETHNTIRDHFDHVMQSIAAARGDDKITSNEVWAVAVGVVRCVSEIVDDFADLGPEDEQQIITLAKSAYDRWIKPLDLPGPDLFIDPLLRDQVLPGLIHGAFEIVRANVMLL